MKRPALRSHCPAALSGALALAGMPCLGAAENETVQREEAGDIPSVYYDLRLEPMGVQSGLPPAWPHALVDLDFSQQEYEWSPQTILLNAPGTPFNANQAPLREVHNVVTAEIRQSLWTPWPWDAELEIDASADDRKATSGGTTIQSDTVLVGDPRAQILFPVWQERYAGVLIGGGVSLPSGDKQDWFAAHDVLGYIASARWTGIVPGVSWLSFGVAGEYRWATNCTQTIYPANPTIDVSCDYQGYTIGGESTYRISRRLAMGVTVLYEHDQFTNIQVPGIAQSIDETVYAVRYGAFLSLMLPNQVFWLLSIKRSQGIDGWIGHDIAVGAQLAVVCW
jgi:hypothetical protein